MLVYSRDYVVDIQHSPIAHISLGKMLEGSIFANNPARYIDTCCVITGDFLRPHAEIFNRTYAALDRIPEVFIFEYERPTVRLSTGIHPVHRIWFGGAIATGLESLKGRLDLGLDDQAINSALKYIEKQNDVRARLAGVLQSGPVTKIPAAALKQAP